MPREHILICRNPEPGVVGWIMARSNGESTKWKVTPSGGNKRVWAQEGIRAAIASNLSANVTITSAPPDAAMADPDTVPENFNLMVICPEGVPSSGRWAVLVMQKNGDFHLNTVERGRCVHDLLERFAAEVTDTPFDRSVIWVRPDFHAEDLLPSRAGRRAT